MPAIIIPIAIATAPAIATIMIVAIVMVIPIRIRAAVAVAIVRPILPATRHPNLRRPITRRPDIIHARAGRGRHYHRCRRGARRWHGYHRSTDGWRRTHHHRGRDTKEKAEVNPGLGGHRHSTQTNPNQTCRENHFSFHIYTIVNCFFHHRWRHCHPQVLKQLANQLPGSVAIFPKKH